MRCDQRSDDDRGNESITKSERKQGAEEQWHAGGDQAEDDRPGLSLAEESDVDLEAGGEHQQQLAELGKEVGDGSVLAERTKDMRTQRTPNSSNPTISGSLTRRARGGTPTMTAMAMANFARSGSARTCDLNASSSCIALTLNLTPY
jgi:hypothetical protein